MAFPGPLSPEQLDEYERAKAYYEGNSSNMSSAATPPPVDPAAFYGPPPPPTGPVPLPPEDPSLTTAPSASVPPPIASTAPAPSPTPSTIDEANLNPIPEGSGIVSQSQSLASTRPMSTVPTREPTTFTRTSPTSSPVTTPPAAAGRYYGAGDFGQDKARKLIRGTYDADIDATLAGGEAEKGRLSVMQEGQERLARERAEDAAIYRLESSEANRAFRKYQDETQRQLDAVRQKKIDPNRLYQDDGAAVMAVVGGVLGGIYQGLNHMAENPFVRDLNRVIDRDIAVQEKNLANEKESVAERRGILGDMRAQFRDEQLANLQARNMYYEATKEEIVAQAARYDIPATDARVSGAINAVTREQGKLDLDAAMKKAAESRAAAAAKAAEDERRRKAALEERHMRVLEGKLLVDASQDHAKANKEAGESFVATGKDPATGLPIGFIARDKEVATKLTDTLTSSDELLASINEARRLRSDQGALGRTLNRGGVLPYQPEWQNKVKSIEKDLGVSWSKSKQLGAYDNGIERLTGEIVGNLDSPGSSSDDKLDELERRVLAARAAMLTHNAGPQAVKTIHPDTGRGVIVPLGTMSSAPNNQRNVQRYDLDGKPR